MQESPKRRCRARGSKGTMRHRPPSNGGARQQPRTAGEFRFAANPAMGAPDEWKRKTAVPSISGRLQAGRRWPGGPSRAVGLRSDDPKSGATQSRNPDRIVPGYLQFCSTAGAPDSPGKMEPIEENSSDKRMPPLPPSTETRASSRRCGSAGHCARRKSR